MYGRTNHLSGEWRLKAFSHSTVYAELEGDDLELQMSYGQYGINYVTVKFQNGETSFIGSGNITGSRVADATEILLEEPFRSVFTAVLNYISSKDTLERIVRNFNRDSKWIYNCLKSLYLSLTHKEYDPDAFELRRWLDRLSEVLRRSYNGGKETRDLNGEEWGDFASARVIKYLEKLEEFAPSKSEVIARNI